MKDIFNWALRLGVKFALLLFYRKITVIGAENLPKNKAVIIISNHQNALIDPLLVATNTSLKPHFLTRASAFKNPVVASLLRFIRMIPVFRVRDGKENMEKNNKTFNLSVSILSSLGSILVFAEGGHSHERSLRSLKKGFTRIAFQTLEKHPNLDLVILPIGINYSNHCQSGATVKLLIGKEIAVEPYLGNHEALMNATSKGLSPLVSQIPNDDYENKLAFLINQSVDLSDPRAIASALDNYTAENQLSISSPEPLAKRIFRVIHWPLWLIWKKLQPKIDDDVFYATFKFVIGLVGIPILYSVLLLIFPLLGLKLIGILWVFSSILSLLSNSAVQR